MLYGVAPVLAALRAERRTPHALYLQDSIDVTKRKDARAVKDCEHLARVAGASLHTATKHDLNMLAGNRPHQGLVLDCSALPWEFMDVMPDVAEHSPQLTGHNGSRSTGCYPVWLALDEVMDPVSVRITLFACSNSIKQQKSR